MTTGLSTPPMAAIEVVLLGAQGDERITAEEIAARCGCIPYEVFCAISQRVPRRYVETDNHLCH